MPAPQYVIRSYGGGADVAQLQQPMGSADQSFAITPTTGWMEDDGSPLGTVGPFTVVIDRFTASVEKILCSSINLTTGVVQVYIDMSDGWSGRGYDGTTPQAHVPGGSPSGVQTCWSSAEAKEANQAVYDVLGGGSEGLIGVPIGSSVPFNGTPLTLPTNFLVEDGSAVSRASYSACFTAITIAATGDTTNGGATITAVSSSITPYLDAGMKVTVTASGGATYTIASVTSTTVVLTSGTGITAASGGGFIVYPHGPGDGSTTFNLPDSRGRFKLGQNKDLNTNAQPKAFVGGTGGGLAVTISQTNLPTTIGTAAAQTATVTDTHVHNGAEGLQYFMDDPGASQFITLSGSTGITETSTTGDTISGSITVANAPSAVTNSGGGQTMSVQNPTIVCTWIIRVT